MLPFVDEHVVRVSGSDEKRREAVKKVARSLAGKPAPRAFAALWKLSPSSGFEVADESAERIELVGHHRFSRYSLAFVIDGDLVKAETRAEFPGFAGWLYRTLVIDSGGHGFAVRAMLRKIRRRARDN